MDLSRNLHDETEKPGQPFPLDTQMIIRDRYEFAAELAKGKSLLEIGCGAGLGLEYLAKSAKSLNAAEYSDENIAALQKRFADKISIEQCDAHDMPYPDGRFDLIIALAMIYYLDIDRFLAEAARVLGDNGQLFFCTSNKDVPGFCPAPFTTGYFTIPELRRRLEASGFRVRFYGAFAAPGGPYWKRRLRGVIKDGLKIVVTHLPGGARLWRKLRQSRQGESFPLPGSIENMAASPHPRILLPSDRRNHDYRVIYVVARKNGS